MQNVNVKSDNAEKKTLSSSSEALITECLMKPENGQTKEVSADSENVTTIKRPYGSMPNISASITNDGDTAAIEAPAAVAVQQVSAKPLEHCPGSTELANYVRPEMQYYVGLVNAEVMVSPAATGEDEIRSPSVTSDPPVSVAQPKHDGSGESDAAKFRIFDGRRPRLWCSMPNIAIHYTDKVFYKTAEIECITPMPVSNDSLTGVVQLQGQSLYRSYSGKNQAYLVVEAGEEIHPSSLLLRRCVIYMVRGSIENRLKLIRLK
ncbi:uncharacterized protein LOC126550502 [Aphis gossypii]|uniref:uncharacterized protein LOC126550502 n=1 Tax=Aphis gossypii TaxID=80765 RepID=UPI002159567A|nr:uncharacterized protein LOC126550502 [Aphis gossypii]